MRLSLLIAVVAAMLVQVPLAAHAQPQPQPAAGDLTIDVNAGNFQPLPIAVISFAGGRGADISKVVIDDLQRSGLFRAIDPSVFPEPALEIGILPQIAAWKGIGAQAVLNGRATVQPDGRLQVDFRLFDASASDMNKELLGLQFASTPENWRRIAHKISDAVYERLTGEKGYFDTRVVFVAESGAKVGRVKRLAIMDQDGANPSYLTDGSYLVMTPRFSATSQEITYMALRPSGASIYLFNIETGRQESLGSFPGMVFAPRFSPAGDKVAFSVERGGNTDIYVMDLRSRQSRRLTTDPSIDTSPSFSPDGNRIAFTSDRGGSPQIYTMNLDGSGVRRVSFGGGQYTTPVWAPRGDFIAFTKQTGGQFHIGVMKADGSDERILTTSFLDEGPTWAPNGRVLMFFRETSPGNPRLWTVDVTGRILRPAPYTSPASDPAWSPLLN